MKYKSTSNCFLCKFGYITVKQNNKKLLIVIMKDCQVLCWSTFPFYQLRVCAIKKQYTRTFAYLFLCPNFSTAIHNVDRWKFLMPIWLWLCYWIPFFCAFITCCKICSVWQCSSMQVDLNERVCPQYIILWYNIFIYKS